MARPDVSQSPINFSTIGMVVSCTLLFACEPPPTTDLEIHQQAITMNPGSSVPVFNEPTTPVGQWREVVFVSGSLSCTGTVVAPNMVLTAGHCGHVGSISWNGGATVETHTAANNVGPPFRGQNSFKPAWWAPLYGASNIDHMFDMRMVTVPGLDEAALWDRRVVPSELNPFEATAADGNHVWYNVIGTASNPNPTLRKWADTRFLTPAPGATNLNGPRDGFLSRDITTPNFARTDAGDSGGPSFISRFFPTTSSGVGYYARRTIVGITQGSGTGRDDSVPFGHNPSIVMTPNQRSVVKLNSQWAMARAVDPDGDGIPAECDTSTNYNTTASSCPSLVGGPVTPPTFDPNTTLSFFETSASEGRLVCRPGFAPHAIAGRHGTFEIRSLQVKCRALTCTSTSCNDPTEEYWTDAFAGDTDPGGGSNYNIACPAGQFMTGLQGSQETGAVIRSIRPHCQPLSDILSGDTSPNSLPGIAGGDGFPGAVAYSRPCGSRKFLMGFHLRTADTQLRWIHGLIPVCTDLNSKFTWSGTALGAGNIPDGGKFGSIQCPATYVAVGVRARGSSGVNRINNFSLVCSKNVNSWSGRPKYYLNSGFLDNGPGFRHSPVMMHDQNVYTPSGTTEVLCPTNRRLVAVEIKADSLAIRKITRLTCRLNEGTSTTTVNVNVGFDVGTTQTLNCNTSSTSRMDGFVHRYVNDMHHLAMHCR